MNRFKINVILVGWNTPCLNEVGLLMKKNRMNILISLVLLSILPCVGFSAVTSIDCIIAGGVDDPLIGGVGAADLPDGSIVQVIWTSNTNTQELNYADADYLNADEVLLGTFPTTSLGTPPLPGATIFEGTYDSTNYSLSDTNFLAGSVFIRVFNGTAPTNSTRFANSDLYTGFGDDNLAPQQPFLIQTAFESPLVLNFVNTSVPEPLPAPIPVFPTTNITDPTPNFMWAAVSNATSYTLMLTMEGEAVFSETILAPATNFQVLDILPCGDYVWSVRANEVSIKGIVSTATSFSIADDCPVPGAPNIIRPVQNQRWRSSTLWVEFSADPLAYEYEIIIRKSGNIWRTLTTAQTLEGFTGLRYGKYSVQVNAVGVNGSTPSAIRKLTYGTQYALTSKVLSDNKILWRDLTHRATNRYQVQVLNNNGSPFFSRYLSPAQAKFKGNRKSLVISKAMKSGRKYKYRVRARQAGTGAWSEWGPIKRFIKK